MSWIIYQRIDHRYSLATNNCFIFFNLLGHIPRRLRRGILFDLYMVAQFIHTTAVLGIPSDAGIVETLGSSLVILDKI